MGTPPPAGWFTSPDERRCSAGGTVPRGRRSRVRRRPGACRRTHAALDLAAHRRRACGPASGQHEKADEALAALQHQGGLLGAFATVASQALHSPAAARGTERYGPRALRSPDLRAPVASEGDVRDRTSNVSWSIGPFSGGSPRPVRRRRRRGTTHGTGRRAVFGLVFLVVGLLAATWMASDNSTHGDESTATGTVVDHEIRVDSDGDRMCSPIASFSVGGTTYTAGSHVSTNHCPDLGTSVTVIYTTAAPGDGEPASRTRHVPLDRLALPDRRARLHGLRGAQAHSMGERSARCSRGRLASR